jgi:hypothetical protein
MPRARGAKPSSPHKLITASRFVAPMTLIGLPPSFAAIPRRLSYWGNAVDGDCVSAEEAFAKAAFSSLFGPEVFIPEETVLDWAGKHGWLDGATLTDPMDAMAVEGMVAEDGRVYKDGPYHAVDWTDDATLSAAIMAGASVKIAVAADQLEQVVGNASGWIAPGFRKDRDVDHCVGLCGFGSLAALCGMLGSSIPPNADAGTRCYLLFTWNTIGVIGRQSMINITAEAWIRTPTTIPSAAPRPAPGPIPVIPIPGPLPLPTPGPLLPVDTPPYRVADDEILISLADHTIQAGHLYKTVQSSPEMPVQFYPAKKRVMAPPEWKFT